VDVLGYGDDPAVEPGDTAVRVYIDRAGRPEENWDSHKTLNDWAEANSEGIGRLHDGLLPLIAWVEFVPDSQERRARPYDQSFGGMKKFMGKRSDQCTPRAWPASWSPRSATAECAGLT
jgi:hypothetical protein